MLSQVRPTISAICDDVPAVPGVGAEFDPEMHEAIDLAPVDAAQDGRITVEYLRGYKLGDKLLRAAKVQVGKAA